MNSMSHICFIIFITFICVDHIIVEGNQCNSRSLFLTQPGGGEVVYAPSGHNATLTCAVSGIVLLWEVNGFRFGESTNELNERHIFESQLMHLSDIMLTSALTVFSDNINHGASICCLARMTEQDTSLEMCCTTLYVYYPPAQPVFKLPEYVRSNGSVKLSWMVNLTQGVDHNYTIVIQNVTTTPSQMVEYKTVVKMYILFEKCGRFDVQVRAINGAGESEPSDTVRLSLPLLPDIQPVSDSLQHKLWKLSGHGQVMLQIRFEPAYFCSEAIIQYCICLRPSAHTGNGVKLCVHSNQTEFLLGLDNGVKRDTFYEYVITAVNDLGNSSSVTKNLTTYHIQSVTIRRVMDNIHNIGIDCHFINGSDAQGCKVVIVSDVQTSVDDITTMLIRSNESDLIASGQLTLTYHIDCYHHVLAFDIEANGTISVNWAIREGIGPKSETPQCNGSGASVLSSVTILTLTVGIIIISVLLS